MTPRALLFADEDALIAALTSELVPPEVQRAPARFFRRPGGGLGVCPEAPLSAATGRELAAAGVSGAAAPATLERAPCWAAMVRPRPAADGGEAAGLALFEVGDDPSLLELVGELVRLGCGRAEFALLAGGGAAVRAFDPPYYSVARGGGADRSGRVYRPAPAGQDRVWIEVGFAHPLLGRIAAPPETLLLVGRDGAWRRLEAAGWRDVFELVDLQVEAPALERRAAPLDQKIAVPLRLVSGRRPEAPRLWLLEDDASRAIEDLLGALPEAVALRLSFAVAAGAGDVALVRARPSRGGPPAIDVGRPLAPIAGVANLFAPADARIEPPLSPGRLANLLAPDPDRIYWIEPGRAPCSIPDDAFAPLSDWVEYVIDREAEAIEPWIRSTRFELTAFSTPPRSPAPRPAGRRWRSFRRGWLRSAIPEPERAPAAPAPAIAAAVGPGDLDRALAAAERAFLDSELPLDHPERGGMWIEMAELHARAGHRRDAAACFARALWEPGPESAARAAAWAAAAPSPIAHLVAGDAEAPSPDAAAALLEDGAAELEVRALWLGRLAHSRRVGGDPLGLARTRDQVMARLGRGLSLARDVPSFLHFAAGGRDRVAALELAAELETLLARYQSTPRARLPGEAPEARTGALVRLEIAAGLAALGRLESARELRRVAVATPRDAIDRVIYAAYSARIDQALEGEPKSAPLPPAVGEMLNRLPPYERYKVDRLRQASTVLEPSERLDPMLAHGRGHRDPRGDELAALRGIADPARLTAALAEHVAAAGAPATAPADRARLLDGILDFLLPLPPHRAAPLLDAAVLAIEDLEAPRRALLYEEALEVAGAAGDERRAAALADRLAAAAAELEPDDAAALAGELAAAARSLRRVGLGDDGTALLATLAAKIAGDSTDARVARLHLAAGAAALGDAEVAESALAAGSEALAGDLEVATRLRLVRAQAVAASQLPRPRAIAGLRRLVDLLPGISDAYNTSTHFCLSVVSFVDALVVGLAGGDLARGEIGRRFLDEDELLVRRRVHRDLDPLQTPEGP